MRRETTLPFVRAQAVRELAWLVCRLEASAEGRSPLVIAGEPVEDGTAGPDPAGTTSMTHVGGAVGLLSPSAVQLAEHEIWAKGLVRRVCEEVAAHLSSPRT